MADRDPQPPAEMEPLDEYSRFAADLILERFPGTHFTDDENLFDSRHVRNALDHVQGILDERIAIVMLVCARQICRFLFAGRGGRAADTGMDHRRGEFDRALVAGGA